MRSRSSSPSESAGAAFGPILGFGALALSSHPALRAIWLTTGLGITLLLLLAPATLLILRPAPEPADGPRIMPRGHSQRRSRVRFLLDRARELKPLVRKPCGPGRGGTHSAARGRARTARGGIAPDRGSGRGGRRGSDPARSGRGLGKSAESAQQIGADRVEWVMRSRGRGLGARGRDRARRSGNQREHALESARAAHAGRARVRPTHHRVTRADRAGVVLLGLPSGTLFSSSDGAGDAMRTDSDLMPGATAAAHGSRRLQHHP
jgi:hypothetical protein